MIVRYTIEGKIKIDVMEYFHLRNTKSKHLLI